MSTEQQDKTRESVLQRKASRLGWRLEKSRRRNPAAHHYGGYMIVDAEHNAVVQGGDPRPYSLSLDDVEQFLSDAEKSSQSS